MVSTFSNNAVPTWRHNRSMKISKKTASYLTATKRSLLCSFLYKVYASSHKQDSFLHSTYASLFRQDSSLHSTYASMYREDSSLHSTYASMYREDSSLHSLCKLAQARFWVYSINCVRKDN